MPQAGPSNKQPKPQPTQRTRAVPGLLASPKHHFWRILPKCNVAAVGQVLELEGWSSRALVNWGRALCIRADLLASGPEGGSPDALHTVAQLYTSAINKFEGVLEGEPDMVPAKYRWAGLCTITGSCTIIFNWCTLGGAGPAAPSCH